MEPISNNQSMANLNTPDKFGNAPLHKAVMSDDMDMLNCLLEQNHIDVNLENYKGETPLILGLRLCRSNSFIMRLVESGSNLNHTNKFGQTSLHVALLCASVEIAHVLIEGGANINAQDEDKRTGLHYAVDNNDLEAVCMFLYHGADVTILCKDNMTPLMLALYRNRLDIVEVLLDYYDDFSDIDVDGFTALHLAACHESPFAAHLVKAGADVNCVTFDGTDPLVMSLKYKDAELFKLIWPIYDHQQLLSKEMSILFTYFNSTAFPTSEWIECMYLILESPLVFEILEHYKNSLIGAKCDLQREETSRKCGCFSLLLWAFKRLGVDSQHRVCIINTCLSYGWEINGSDISLGYVLYGFNEELESFLCCSDGLGTLSHYPDLYLTVQPSFLFALDRELVGEEVFNALEDQVRYCDLTCSDASERVLLDSLGFFALPSYTKQAVLEFAGFSPAVGAKLETVPEFPSLLELSRNRVRRVIKDSGKVNRAYQVHDMVRRLNLPQRICKIISFRSALY